MDVVYNPSNINQQALEELVNSLTPNSSSDDLSNGVQNTEDNECSQNYLHNMTKPISKKRIQRFTDSDNDDEELHKTMDVNSDVIDNKSENDEENNTAVKNNKYKSRIRAISSSENDEDNENVKSNPNNTYNLSRVKNKKEKLAAKFNKLLSKQHKYASNNSSSDDQSSSDQNVDQDSENSDQEINSCNKIKKMFKKREMVPISSICDPDTSDDEDIMKKNKKSIIKTTKLTSPKPTRISAKQAMENMHKIKSEANRMLREKEVSLPYHKPRALSLKDIMSRRKPALAPDGKTLSVKMTAEQLEQYALQLEQRQKEMMELCKSDDDGEEYTENKHNQEMDNHGQIESFEPSENTPINDQSTNLIHLHNNYTMEPVESVDSKVNEGNRTGLVNIVAVVDSTENNIESACCTEVNTDKKNLMTKNEIISNVTKVDVNKVKIQDDSQIMELKYDSEKRDSCDLSVSTAKAEMLINIEPDTSAIPKNDIECFDFSENDFNLDDVDEIHENVEISDLGYNTSKQIVGTHSLTEKPKLIGSPGMVIDLETGDTSTEKKLTGVELLKERFQYFAKLKSLEEQEKDREKKYKPGMQHLKLRQELEDQIAEQRSLEWAKRLDNENQQSQCDDTENDDIEKLEAKLEKLDESMISKGESSESSEDEEIEDDCVIEDKPRKRNPMLDDEAEESDIEEDSKEDNNLEKDMEIQENGYVNTSDEDINSSSEESEDESSESDNELIGKEKKSRILKAFQDSDDEDNSMISATKNHDENNSQNNSLKKDLNNSTSQDEELQLAQMLKTSSEDNCTQDVAHDALSQCVGKAVKSQSFSIAHSHIDSTLNCLEKLVNEKSTRFDAGFADKNIFLDNFSQNLNTQQGQNSITESQEIGDDIAALCTGKFYDNPLVSQFDNMTQSEDRVNLSTDFSQTQESLDTEKAVSQAIPDDNKKEENQALSSILEELNDPDFDKPKQNKYFAKENSSNKENMLNIANNSAKKKFVIDSDEDNDEGENDEKKIKKKNKKRKKEKKALQFSDDEEDEFEEANEDVESVVSDIDDDSQRIVDYDSEENEVVMELPKSKKKHIGDFFEQEAELTSEDEWVGSGDEDEKDLDRMEREEGDNDVFQEDKLRNELGQIHMRDVLDQDKREVRLLQELLFEDGDLGDGHRQRRFRWRNADDVDETGATLDDLAETQEEEFESEEQWRKQRHEREVFLRKMKGIDDDDLPNTSINRTSIIKANLCSRTMSSLLDKSSENIAKIPVAEKRTNKDIPSPKKPFPVFQQNHHGSLLSRGKGALARLAAIATPLAADNDDAPKAMAANNRGKFVFAALTPDEVEPKVSKRKADAALALPENIKKLKTEETQIHLKSSLFDYL